MNESVSALGISLAEIVLMLFFLLLLLLVGSEKKCADELSTVKEEQAITAQQKQEIEDYLMNFARALQDPEALDESAPVLTTMRKVPEFLPSDKKDLLAEAVEKIFSCRSAMAAQQVAGAEEKNVVQEAAVLKSANAALQDALRESVAEVQAAQRTIDDVNRINREFATKLAECSDGWGYPPCWRDKDGNIQYMLEVHLQENGIAVKRAWPDIRSHEMEQVPAVTGLVGQTVDLEEFLSATREVFQDSVNRQCRHFIRVSGDKEAMNSRMFTDYQGVQDHFYHLNEIR